MLRLRLGGRDPVGDTTAQTIWIKVKGMLIFQLCVGHKNEIASFTHLRYRHITVGYIITFEYCLPVMSWPQGWLWPIRAVNQFSLVV